MTMADRQSDAHFRLDTDWAGYLKILDVVGERPIKVTYDRGRLELMSPGRRHERRKTILGGLVEAILEELAIPCEPGGGMTFKREDLDRGFEPDECYWIAHRDAVTDTEEWDPHSDPPPDLAIEVEVSSGLVKRLDIYHAIRIPEVWRWTVADEVDFMGWAEEGYVRLQRSRSFPWLTPEVIQRFVVQAMTGSAPLILPEFRKEVRRRAGDSSR